MANNTLFEIYQEKKGFLEVRYGCGDRTSRHMFYRQKELLLKNKLSAEIQERKEKTVAYGLRNETRYSLVREFHHCTSEGNRLRKITEAAVA